MKPFYELPGDNSIYKGAGNAVATVTDDKLRTVIIRLLNENRWFT